MGRQRNISQKEEQEKSLAKGLNKMEASNLPHIEFKKIVVTRMLKKLVRIQQHKKGHGNHKKRTSQK